MWASKMAHGVKMLEAILDYLSWIPGTNMMKESWLLHGVLWPSHICHCACIASPHFKLANTVNVSPSTLCYKSGTTARGYVPKNSRAFHIGNYKHTQLCNRQPLHLQWLTHSRSLLSRTCFHADYPHCSVGITERVWRPCSVLGS